MINSDDPGIREMTSGKASLCGIVLIFDLQSGKRRRESKDSLAKKEIDERGAS
jgi:hypothetical protein